MSIEVLSFALQFTYVPIERFWFASAALLASILGASLALVGRIFSLKPFDGVSSFKDMAVVIR